jgi:hypothetical protein
LIITPAKAGDTSAQKGGHMPATKTSQPEPSPSILPKLNESTLSTILGIGVVVIIGSLIINYFQVRKLLKKLKKSSRKVLNLSNTLSKRATISGRLPKTATNQVTLGGNSPKLTS